jgi:hypothetical protein
MMVRTWPTWLVAGGVVALLVAAAFDVLRSSGSSPSPSILAGSERSLVREQEPTSPPPRCTAQQVALRIENLGGSPALSLDHVWAGPCRTRRLPIDVALLDRAGKAVEATVDIPQAFAPATLSSDKALSAPFSYVYLCGEPKPAFAHANAGPYSARGRLPQNSGACLDDLGP